VPLRYVLKNYFFITNKGAKLARAFNPGKPFQSDLIFLFKARVFQSNIATFKGKVLFSLMHFIGGCHYFKIRFLRQCSLGVNVLKHSLSVSDVEAKKLKQLSLARFSGII